VSIQFILNNSYIHIILLAAEVHPPIECIEALDDLQLTAKFIKTDFFYPVTEMIYNKSDMRQNIAALKIYYNKLLDMYYGLEDYEAFIQENVVSRIQMCKNQFKSVQTYRNRYDKFYAEFNKAVSNTKLAINVELSHRFPKTRDLDSFPRKVHTEVYRPETPPEPSTIIENSIVGQGEQVAEPIQVDASDQVISGEPRVDTIDSVSLMEEQVSDSLSYYTARTQPVGPIMLEIDKNDISLYIQQQHNFITVKRTLRDKPENIALKEIVYKSHGNSLPKISDPINFPAVGLPNLMNTCYIGSVLQCFFRSSYVMQFMLDYNPGNHPGPSCMNLLHDVYSKMLSNASSGEINAAYKLFVTVSLTDTIKLLK